jgi:hypothetical protein
MGVGGSWYSGWGAGKEQNQEGREGSFEEWEMATVGSKNQKG